MTLTRCDLPRDAKPIPGTLEFIANTKQFSQRYETPDGTAYEVVKRGRKVIAVYRIDWN